MRKRTLYVSELITRNINEDIVINILTNDKRYILTPEKAIELVGNEQVKTWQITKTLVNRILIIRI